MAELAAALALLQLGDSFFPTGAASFSWGLETLRADGLVRGPAEVEGFLSTQLSHRWAQFDRPVVLAAHAAGGDLTRVREADLEADRGTLAREAREGGRRIGAALLRTHATMGTAGAAAYREQVSAGHAPGQAAAVLGLVGRASGLDAAATCALSAYGLGSGIVGAALRLGLLGHVDAQRILLACRSQVVLLANRPALAVGAIHAHTPMTDIAMMRHETGTGRLFAS